MHFYGERQKSDVILLAVFDDGDINRDIDGDTVMNTMLICNVWRLGMLVAKFMVKQRWSWYSESVDDDGDHNCVS